MNDPVECHSGFTYAQRPIALHWNGERLRIAEILNEWRSPRAKHFKVVTVNSQVFEITYCEDSDQWGVVPWGGDD